MHGQCVSHASVDLYRASRQVKLRDIPHEIECTGEHDRATDGGDERPWRPPGGLRKRIVERAHTPRLTKETECMPWQGHYHDSDEPQPEGPSSEPCSAAVGLRALARSRRQLQNT